MNRQTGELTNAQTVFDGEVAEWSNAAVLKTVNPQGFVGSNPTLSVDFKNYPAKKGKIMRKALLAFFAVFLLSASAVFAETVADEDAAKELTDRIMASVGEGDLGAAFNRMKLYIPLSPLEIDDVALKSKSLRAQYGERYGKSEGFEFIDSKRVGGSLLRLRYIEKTENHALPWVFYFYKTQKGWILNSFDWNDIYKSLFENN